MAAEFTNLPFMCTIKQYVALSVQEFVDNFPTKCSVAGVSLEAYTCYTS